VIPPTELGELEAFRSLLAGHAQAEIGGALCLGFEQTPTSAMFNRALGIGLTEPSTEAGLDEIEAFFTRRGLAYVTETGEPVDGKTGGSYRNLLRAGFEPLYVRQNYVSSEQADTSGTRA
jgi:hypothetical protein